MKPVSLWIVAELAMPSGRQLVLDALKFMVIIIIIIILKLIIQEDNVCDCFLNNSIIVLGALSPFRNYLI